jgi:Heparinase II/III-like protein.
VINLLHATPPPEELRRILRDHPPRPLLPPLGDAAWTKAWRKPLLAPFVREILRIADAEAATPSPTLSDELYADYAKTGARLPFENLYFARRRMLARAAVALLIEGGERRAQAFVGRLRDIFEEASWAMPAHVPGPTGKDTSVIDLFAAETANLMGECLNVFGAMIPDDLQTAIRRRLREQMFERYLREPSFWWITGTNNWNAVCNQGVLGAALATLDDVDLLSDLLLRAASSLPAFLSGYGEDGACSEGPGYWGYGFGWFSVLNEQLETRTNGALSLFAGDEKVRKIASYGPAVVLAKHHVVNFSDCAQTIVLRPPLLEYLGRRLDLPECRAQAAENYAWLAAHPFNYEGQRADLFHWLRFFLLCPDDDAPVSSAPKADCYFPQLAVWIVRGRDRAGHLWELAAKGGHNDEHHNHNDLGGFILNIDGTPFVSEIGAPEYVRDFFSPRRYEFLAARSLGHSVPLVNGHEQAAGAEYRSRVLRSETGREQTGFEIEFAGAYPEAAACRGARRTLELDKTAGFLRWTDEITVATPAGPTESALVTHAEEVSIESAQVALIRNEGLTLELRAEPGSRWDRVERHVYKKHDGGDHAIRRLVLVPETPATTMRFDVRLSLRRTAA